MSNALISHSTAKGFYPERHKAHIGALEEWLQDGIEDLRRRIPYRRANLRRIARAVNLAGQGLESLSDSELKPRVVELRMNLRRQGLTREHAIRSFALVREQASRRLGMRHFDVQVMGGWVLLQGRVAEMDTGEGKTLTATLAASTAALAGIPTHVITVNHYLAQRDADIMRPLYEAMGLTVGVVVQGMTLEQRQSAYRCDITYCTNKEIVFDYLKDRLILGQSAGDIRLKLESLHQDNPRIRQLRLRGLCYAIVDEADSVLIDEARVPLILSAPGDHLVPPQVYHQALELVQDLIPDVDFVLHESKRKLEFTECGIEHLEKLGYERHGLWRSKMWREEMAYNALLALNLFHRDREYILRDGKVMIVDGNTGRVMQDRSWERGLHQMIEAKEDCEITPQKFTMARMSFQKFFRRYRHISGMTGTARETVSELWSVYRLRVVAIPPNKRSRRVKRRPHLFMTAEEKWQAVVERIREVHAIGRPILVGTCSVESSELLSRRLNEMGLEHNVLNARQDAQEAEIVAMAGQPGQITVATNMAGRGTDIKLPPEVTALGGLHVIATERHESRRIDRQLFGRCGRQGDPGCCEMFASLEDPVLSRSLQSRLGYLFIWFLSRLSHQGWLGNLFAYYAQVKTESAYFAMRNLLIQQDEYLEQHMAFTGKGE